MKVRSAVFLAAALACFLSLAGSALAVAPGNDNFAGATALPFGTLAKGTNVEATAQGGAGEGTHGGVAASHSVWLNFTPEHSGPAQVSIYAPGFTPVATVYTGTTLAGLTKVVDSSEVETKEAEFEGVVEKYFDLDFNVVGGQKYSVAIDTGNGATGSFEIAASEPFAATNDDFADAEAVAGNSSVPGTTTETTAETGEPTHGGLAASHSVWFAYTAATAERTILGVQTEGFKPSVTVYTGSSLGGLTKVVDGVEFVQYIEPEPGYEYLEVAFDATAGQKFKIAVDTRNGSTGEFDLNINTIEVEPNDAFAAPVTLSGDTAHAAGNTGIATTEANEPGHSGFGPYGSLWFSWTAGSNGSTEIDTAGSPSDTRLGVYTGSSLTSLVPVAESDDVSMADKTSAVTFDATSGTTYRIVVDNGRSAPEPWGPFTLSLSHTPAAPQSGGAGGSGGKAAAVSVDTAVKAPKSIKLKGKAKKAKVTLKLSSAAAGATFECSVDHGSFKACPATFAVSLKKGKHTIEVRAKASDGSVDATPATAAVTVKAAPKPKHKKNG